MTRLVADQKAVLYGLLVKCLVWGMAFTDDLRDSGHLVLFDRSCWWRLHHLHSCQPPSLSPVQQLVSLKYPYDYFLWRSQLFRSRREAEGGTFYLRTCNVDESDSLKFYIQFCSCFSTPSGQHSTPHGSVWWRRGKILKDRGVPATPGTAYIAHDVKTSSASHNNAMESQNGETITEPNEEVTDHSTPKKPSKRSTSPSSFRKPCDLCHVPKDVLVRCQTDSTATWHFICPKKCWKDVSGGVVDGSLDHPYYKYGGVRYISVCVLSLICAHCAP